jgi:hypothetical protein
MDFTGVARNVLAISERGIVPAAMSSGRVARLFW